jgi:integrase
MILISGSDQTSSRLPGPFSLFLPGSCPNNRNRCNHRRWPPIIISAGRDHRCWPPTIISVGRHTAASRLLRKTGNLKMVQRLLGHKNIQTTARYAHVFLDDEREGMEAEDKAQS